MLLRQGLIKPHASQFAFISRCMDCLLIVAGVAIVGWYSGSNLNSNYWVGGLAAGMLHQIFADFTDIYRSWRAETPWAEARQVCICWLASFFPVFLVGQFGPTSETLFAWPMFAQWFVSALALMLIWRIIVRTGLRLCRRNGFHTRTAAVIGTGDLAQMVAERLQQSTWAGHEFQGFYDDRSEKKISEIDQRDPGSEQSTVKPAGNLSKLIDRAEKGELDSIYIAMPMRAEKRIKELVTRLSNSSATVYVVPNLFVFDLLYARCIDLNGLPAISLIGEPNRGLNGILKRLEDIILSSIILTLISPLMLMIAYLVKITSDGPVIFKQHRYGMDGKPIEVWKFRTMKVMENGKSFRQATKDDDRITRIGRILRRTSLDELPQFINVLQGTMSIVGPRPHAVAHNEEFRSIVKSYMRRHKVKPGITGWAQINGYRGETDTLEKMEKRVECDLEYINNWSFWWDILIIMKTFTKGFTGKNAY